MVESTGTPMVESIGTLAASAAALALTISTTSMTGDDGHDDGPNNKGFINVASTARSSGTFANKAGTFMVGCMTGLVASAAALASTILMTATAGAPSINDGNADNSGGGYVVPLEFDDDGDGDTQQLATAGDNDGNNAGDTQQHATAGDDTDTNDAAHTQQSLSLPPHISLLETPSSSLSYPPHHRPYHQVDLILAKFCLRKVEVPAHLRMAQATPYNVNNTGNDGDRTVVPLEFVGDDAGTNNAGDMQQNATAAGAYVTNSNDDDVVNTLARMAGRPTIEHPVLGLDLPTSPEVHPAERNNSLMMVPPGTMTPAHHPTLVPPSPTVVKQPPLQTRQSAQQVSPSHPLPTRGGISPMARRRTQRRHHTGRRNVPRAPSHLEKVSPSHPLPSMERLSAPVMTGGKPTPSATPTTVPPTLVTTPSHTTISIMNFITTIRTVGGGMGGYYLHLK